MKKRIAINIQRNEKSIRNLKLLGKNEKGKKYTLWWAAAGWRLRLCGRAWGVGFRTSVKEVSGWAGGWRMQQVLKFIKVAITQKVFDN